MTSSRAPLFSVGLAFAIGCLLGLDRFISWPVAVGLFVAAVLVWIFLTRHKGGSLAAFYIVTVCAGLTHTLLLGGTIAPDDVQCLPSEKALASTQWRGEVVEEPQLATRHSRRALDRTSFTVKLSAWRPTGGQLFGEEIEAPWRTASGRVSCTVLGPAQDIRGGDELEFATALEPIPAPLSPGQLDLRAYDAERNIYSEAIIPVLDWRRSARTGTWWQELPYRARDWAYARLQIGLEDDPRTADFLAGMLIGYREEIPADIEQDFRVTGTLHVFAISGQNIAEMVVVAIILLQLCGLVRWRWAWLLAPVVLIYCLLAGSPASAVRATVMALAVLAAWRLGRPLSALGCWSIAFLAMLIWDPRMLFDPGAQLSFGVVLGLILISPPIYRVIVRGLQHDSFLPKRLLTTGQKREEVFWSFAAGLLAASIAATLASEPITALDFYQVTPISIVANLLVVPLAGLITVVGTISVVSSLVSFSLAGLFNNANWAFARLMIAIVSYFAHEPGAAINVPDLRALGQPSPFFVAVPLQDSACLLVKNQGHAWLIDTGRDVPPPSTPAKLLQFYGVNRLDGLILAQPSTPDNGGAALIARQFHPRHLVVPVLSSHSPLWRTLPDIATAAGVPIERWQRGQTFDFGTDLHAEVLDPATDSTATREDDRSLVLLFHANGGTLLWAARLDAAGQSDLLKAFPNLRAGVLLWGGDTAPPTGWLRALGARCWLCLPPRQRFLNTSSPREAPPGFLAPWPLEQTGAVTVHFVGGTSPGFELKPWVALPPTQSTQ
jgi:ComEC/Rec2-related protein